RHEVAAVLLTNAFDAAFHFLAEGVERGFEIGDAAPRRDQVVFELEDALHAREADAFVAQLLDAPQQRDVALAVAPAATARARRLDEALAFVDAQRLRVHARELGRDRDHVQRSGVSFHRSPPRPIRSHCPRWRTSTHAGTRRAPW